jgi:hypothetical protein
VRIVPLMANQPGPMITAVLQDGPLSGTTTEVPAVEGRPPKTIDVDQPGAGSARYCLEGWNQSGHSALYSFLYDV